MIVVLFGAAVAMFGGGSDSNSYTPVSAEVEAYEPIIQKLSLIHIFSDSFDNDFCSCRL